jgi:hypothetical protein
MTTAFLLCLRQWLQCILIYITILQPILKPMRTLFHPRLPHLLCVWPSMMPVGALTLKTWWQRALFCLFSIPKYEWWHWFFAMAVQLAGFESAKNLHLLSSCDAKICATSATSKKVVDFRNLRCSISKSGLPLLNAILPANLYNDKTLASSGPLTWPPRRLAILSYVKTWFVSGFKTSPSRSFMLLDMYYIQSHSQQRHCRGLGILIPSFLVLSFCSFKSDEVAEIAH